MKNRMTMNHLSTYLPFWEEMEKRLSKSIERKDLAEVQSIFNRAYMKALEVGFEEGVKNMYSAQDMEAFAEYLIGRNTEWITKLERNETAKTLVKLWEQEMRKKED